MVNLINGFSEQEKAAAFAEIAKRYLDKNFGTMTKSEFETLMFSICIEHLLDANQDNQDMAISDYNLSKLLGISQTRIRNLKIRKELLYPRHAFDWRKSFAVYVQNARFDVTKKKIYINIHDPNVYIEVQQYIESFGGYIEKQLNQKLLVISPEYLITLLVDLDDDNKVDKKELMDKIRNNLRKDSTFEKVITKETLPEILEKEAPKVLFEILALFPGGSLAGQIAKSTQRIIENKI